MLQSQHPRHSNHGAYAVLMRKKQMTALAGDLVAQLGLAELQLCASTAKAMGGTPVLRRRLAGVISCLCMPAGVEACMTSCDQPGRYCTILDRTLYCIQCRA